MVQFGLKPGDLTWVFNYIHCHSQPSTEQLESNVIGFYIDGREHWNRPDICIGLVFDKFAGDPTPKSTLRHLHPSSIGYSVLRGWIVHCQNHHLSVCSPFWGNGGQWPPILRVIDCATRSVIDTPAKCEFAALSYVWGEATHRNSDESSILSLGALPETLPLVISDAMKVVLELRLRYLWVDKYCIDQTNPTELQSQISAMNLVYDRAVVTIVPGCGDDASFGLPGVSSRHRIPQPTLNLDGRLWVSGMQNPQKLIRNSPWNSRGWNFQEGLFSRRRLVFTEEQVYFECNEYTLSELEAFDLHLLFDQRKYRQNGLFVGGMGRKVGLEGLDRLMARYTRRHLSYESDILNGLGGILRAFSTMPSPTRTFWGIPMDCYNGSKSAGSPFPMNKEEVRNEDIPVDRKFAFGLSWKPTRPAKRRLGFPTWSWAGWMGPLPEYPWGTLVGDFDAQVAIWIEKNDNTYEKLTDRLVIELNDCSTLGSVYLPKLQIEAWTLELQFRYFPEGLPFAWDFDGSTGRPIYTSTYTLEHDGHIYWPLILTAEVEEGGKLHEELCEQTLVCVRLGWEFGLVVRPKGDAWERIGHIYKYGKDKKEQLRRFPQSGVAKPSTREGGKVVWRYIDEDLFKSFPQKKRTLEIV